MTPVHLALVQMTGARLIGLAITVCGFAVLGRLLDPAAFGHFAIAFSVYNLFKILSNFGLRQYIIRAQDDVLPGAIAAATSLSLFIAAAGCLICWATALVFGGGLMPAPIAVALVPLGAACWSAR